MREIDVFIFLGWLLAIVFTFSETARARRTPVVLAGSLYFLVYSLRSALGVGLTCAWILGVYALACWIARRREGRWIVTGYSALTVAALFAYKLQVLDSGREQQLLDAAVPLGFSFIMFYSIALLFDLHHRKLEQPPPPLEFFSSILFFPTFSVGPFARHSGAAATPPAFTSRAMFDGYCLFCVGVFKFSLSGWILKPFVLGALPLEYSDTNRLHPLVILLLASVFLHTNFSGYSDMVIGVSKIMGYEIAPNFRFPFLATSVAEYWRRWHISLGNWFREYVFYPLAYRFSGAGLRVSDKQAASAAVFITFLGIGLWHGLSAKLLLFGILSGLLVASEAPRVRARWLAVPVAFCITLLMNGLFLSKDLPAMGDLLTGIFRPVSGSNLPVNFKLTLFAFACLGVTLSMEQFVYKLAAEEGFSRRKMEVMGFGISGAALAAGIILGIGRVKALYIGY